MWEQASAEPAYDDEFPDDWFNFQNELVGSDTYQPAYVDPGYWVPDYSGPGYSGYVEVAIDGIYVEPSYQEQVRIDVPLDGICVIDG